MRAATLVSVDDYLQTSYDPDVEYVDGVLVERNVGDWLHSLVQRNVIVALSNKYPNVYAVPELRSQTSVTRFRLPDVCVLLSAPTSRYLLDAAHIAIEILSASDNASDVLEKLEEYAVKGVPYVWLLDPRLRRMSTYRDGVLTLVRGDRLTTDDGIELTREEIFRS